MASYSGPAPTIPDWLLLNSGKPSAEELARLKAPRAGMAARNTTIPVLYGRERIDGKLFYAQVDKANGFLYVGYLLCEGEADAIEAVLMDGVDVTTGLLTKQNAALEGYKGGADNVASPLLKAANIAVGLPAYNDTLPGTCYVVLKIPRGASSGFPRVEAIVRGRKVYDPRKDSTNGGSGSHRLANKATWQWSDNPTLCFADFCTQLAGWDVVWSSITENANYNDTLIAGEKKRTVGLLMQAQASASEWAQGFRVYMGAYLARENGAIRVVADRADVIPGTTAYNNAIAGTDLAALRAVNVAYHFRPDDIKEGTLSLKHRSSRNSPNSVIVDYTEARLIEGWRTESVQVDSPTIAAGAPRRNSKVSLPGIKNRSQAYRESVERLNWFLSDLEGSFTAWDEGLGLQVGSIIAITHPSPVQLVAKLFRIVGHSVDNGRWSYNIAEYSPDMYSDAAVPPDDFVPPVQVDPTVVPDIVGLVGAEELFTYKDGTIRSRVRIAWSPDASPYLQSYQVEAWVGTKMLFQTTTKVASAYTDAIEELNNGQPTDVVVKVAAVYSNLMGKYTTATVPVRGKQTPPPAITTAVASAGSEQVTLDWVFPTTEKMQGTEIWVGTVNNLGNATKRGLAPYPANNATLTGLTAEVPVYIWLRLVDQVGNVGAYFPANATSGLTATPIKSAAGKDLATEIANRQAEDARVAADAAAALAGEASQRIAAVSAANDRITTLTGTVNQNAQDAAAALLAQKTNLEGQITTLNTTLSAADTALGQRIDRVTAGMSQIMDAFKQWTFDTTIEGWASNGGTPTVSNGWLRPFNSSNAYLTSPTSLAAAGATYNAVMARVRKSAGAPVWKGTLWWVTDADTTFNAAKSVTIPEPAWDANGTAIVLFPDIAWGSASPIRQIRLDLTTVQSSTNAIEVDWVALGRVSPGASIAGLQTEATARADGDTAQATARETLATQLRGGYTGTDINAVTSGLIFSERQARVTAVEAVASSVTSLTSQLGNIGGDNLFRNSSFETRANDTTIATGWMGLNSVSASYSYPVSPLAGSTVAMRVSATSTASSSYIGCEPTAASRPAAMEGQRHTLSGYVKGMAGRQLQLYIIYLDAAGTQVASNVGLNVLTETLARYQYTAPAAPANTVAVRACFRLNASASGQALWIEVDNAQLQLGEVATNWIPSADEMGKSLALTANAVTALDTRVSTAEGNITSLSSQYTSLTASLQNIGGDNQLGNSGFDTGTAVGWTAGSGSAGSATITRTFVDSTLPGSTKAARWDIANLPTGSYYEYVSNTSVKSMRAEPGSVHTMSTYVRGNYGVRVFMQFRWNDASGAAISYSGSPGGNGRFTEENWKRLSWSATAPAGAVTVNAYIRVYGSATADQWVEWDNVQLQVGAIATGYAPSLDYIQGVVNATSTALTSLDARVVATEGSIQSLSTASTTLTNKMLGLRTLGDNLIANSDFGAGLEWWGSRLGTGPGNTIVWGASSGNGGAGVVITRGASAAGSPYLEYNEGKWLPIRAGSTARRQFRAYVWAKADTAGAVLLSRLSVRTNGASEGQADVSTALTTSWARYTIDWAGTLETRTECLPRFFATTQGTSVSISSVEVYDVTEQLQTDAQAQAITSLQSSVGTINGQITALSTSTTKLTAQIGNLAMLRVIANAVISSATTGGPYASGIRDASNAVLVGANRGFNLIPLNADGTLGTRTVFDTYGTAAKAQELADAITAIPENQYFLIYTSDALGNIQTTSAANTALKNVMLDAGASTATWTLVNGSRMYIFVGRRRLGPGAGIEVISPSVPAGSSSTRQDLWCEYILQFSNGIPSGLDANRGLMLSTEATAQALTDLTARVTTAEGNITSTASQVTTLSASIQSIGGDNLLPNSSYEDSPSATTAPTSWLTENSAGGLTVSYVDSPMAGGGRALRLSATATAAGQYIGLASTNVYADKLKAQPNTDYTLSTYARGSAGCTLRLYVQFVNSANTVVATVTSQDVITTGEWQRVQVPARTTAASAVAMRVFVGRLFSVASGAMALELDNAMLQQGSVATNYMPSALDLSGKVSANSAATSALSSTVSSIDGRVTAQAGQITSLTANVAGKADATIVQAMQVQVSNAAGGDNLLQNTSFPNWSRRGWGWGSNPYGFQELGNPTGDSAWMPPSIYGIGSVRGGNPGGAGIVLGWFGTEYQIPVQGNKTYDASAWLNTHRCSLYIEISYWNSAGQNVGQYTSAETGAMGLNPSGGLTGIPRRRVKSTAPATAAYALFRIIVKSTGEDTPYIWMFRPMFAEVDANATESPPWNAGGQETFAEWSLTTDVNGYIAGLQLRNTGTTSNFRVLADKFEIVSPSGGQRLEYSGGNIRTYDSNGVLRVQIGVW